MAQPGDHFIATISPTDASGNPAPVSNVIWSSVGYDSVGTGNQCTLLAGQPATGCTVTAKATSAAGVELTQTVDLPDIVAPQVPEAVALNLTVVPA